MNRQTQYDRKPIVLSSHSVALIHIYERNSYFEDVWTVDLDDYISEENLESSAKQFVDQLENHWCVTFMEALINEIQKRLNE